MTVQYLLPCRCGQQTVVEPRQAGETITCSCGASLQIPTLLGMADLEPAPQPSTPKPSKTGWGLKHRLRLLGIVLTLAAVAGGGWLYMHPPTSRFHAIDPEQIRQNYKTFTPSVTWDGWKYMQKGLDRRIDQDYAAAVLRFRAWQVVVGAAALCGIVLIVAGTVGTRQMMNDE